MEVGGSVQEISIAARNFAVASDADVKLNLGAMKPTAHRNGNGSTRYTYERQSWSLSELEVSIDASGDQLQFLQDIANSLEPVDCTITLADDTIYQGVGRPDLGDYSTAKATISLALVGSGQLTRQVGGITPRRALSSVEEVFG